MDWEEMQINWIVYNQSSSMWLECKLMTKNQSSIVWSFNPLLYEFEWEWLETLSISFFIFDGWIWYGSKVLGILVKTRKLLEKGSNVVDHQIGKEIIDIKSQMVIHGR